MQKIKRIEKTKQRHKLALGECNYNSRVSDFAFCHQSFKIIKKLCEWFIVSVGNSMNPLFKVVNFKKSDVFFR